ncbi:MAG TPA: hypothetical protein VF389_11625 [Woeseiaceae bacterium]
MSEAVARAIEDGERALRNIKAVAGRAAPACRKCSYFVGRDWPGDLCRHPAIAPPRYDALNERIIYPDVTAGSARATLCGIEGNFYAPRTIRQRLGDQMSWLGPFLIMFGPGGTIIIAVLLFA